MKSAPMPADYLAAAQMIAGKIAAKAKSRLINRARAADYDDLQQQCLLYCIEIYRKGGWHDELEGYRKICWTHCFRRIGLYSVRQQAPVTCGRDSQVTKQLPATIASHMHDVSSDADRAPGHGTRGQVSDRSTHHQQHATNYRAYYFEVLSAPASQERETEIASVRAKIRARMSELGGDTPGTWEALAGWLDDVDPAEAAEVTGVPLASVYGANKRFARAAREDQTLRALALALALARDMAVSDDSEYVGVA